GDRPGGSGEPVEAMVCVTERLEAERAVQVTSEPLGCPAEERAGHQADEADEDGAPGEREERIRHHGRRLMARLAMMWRRKTRIAFGVMTVCWHVARGRGLKHLGVIRARQFLGTPEGAEIRSAGVEGCQERRQDRQPVDQAVHPTPAELARSV